MIDPAAFEALLPLTVPEVRRLLRLVLSPAEPVYRRALAWSLWRRRHQARAKQPKHHISGLFGFCARCFRHQMLGSARSIR